MTGGARHRFTVFTPTFNRARTLRRLHDSLAAQTYRDFEWLIVDDGSTDDTADVVASFAGAAFPIRCLRQANAGKHVAFNRGVREARGELFLNVDSDDALVPTALERLDHHWRQIPAPERARFSAVTGLCADQHGRLVGVRFPTDVLDSDSAEVYFRYRLFGERCGFQRTDVLRAHPFPEPEGVRFVPERVVWFAIARGYRTRYVNEVFRIYYREDVAAGEKLSALTSGTARGRLLFHRLVLNEYFGELRRSPAQVARSAINYARYSFTSGLGLRSQLGALSSPARQAAVLLAAPLGYALHLRDSGGARR